MAAKGFVIAWCLICLAVPAWAGQALLVQGMEAQKAGRNQQALELLNKYIAKYPQVTEARYYRALALSALDKDKEALEDVDRPCRITPPMSSFSWPRARSWRKWTGAPRPS